MTSLLAPAHVGSTRINCLALPPRRNSCQLRASAFRGAQVVAFQRVTPQLSLVCSSSRHGSSITCLFGGKKESPEKKDSDDSPWRSFENAMGNFKKRSIDDILRDQIREQELNGGGGSEDPPRGGGGSGEDDSGDTGDGGLVGTIDEFFQVVFAFLGFISLCMYLVNAPEWNRLVKDYIRYRFGANTSVRLRKARAYWREFRYEIKRKIAVIVKKIKRKKAVRRRRSSWLERAVLKSPIWWQNRKKLRRRMLGDGY